MSIYKNEKVKEYWIERFSYKKYCARWGYKIWAIVIFTDI
jgi:hypothetical protein